ncbi:MAG: GyrI-like domain-containing protein [Chloroflexi bacterium]|nr:GyrI-like domain-containing protein [Chloroflexota bacterium]MCC6893064.1 GyrI-like domain-containing protein [Anaerolineae bacterium]
MTKIDFKKTLKDLYSPSTKTVAEVVVPPMNYLMVDGYGDPNDMNSFQPRVEVLYALSYNLKFASKKQLGQDYVVMPVEGLWWVEGNLPIDPTTSDRSTWLWTLMVMQPDFITQAMVEAAVKDVREKKNPALLDNCRFERYDEGRAAQTLHLGPYSAEKPTIDRVHAYIDAQGGKPTLKHHEIYLSDARKTAPEHLRTIIRQPFG